MIDRIQPLVALPATILQYLSPEDHPSLWSSVFAVLAQDASTLGVAALNLYAEVGACSHWLRPHQKRWTAAGGFAYPIGYGDGEGFIGGGLPALDWSTRLLFVPTSTSWEAPQPEPTKRFHSVRVAIPARSTRHRQAAVHTVWPRGTLDEREKRVIFYGFRNVEGVWKLQARTKER